MLDPTACLGTFRRVPVIDALDLQRAYGERRVLEGVTLAIRRGERVGLVGDNGSGKSTLARLLAGLEEADGGRLNRRRDARIAYLPQEPELAPGRSLREVVLESLAEWNQARALHSDLTRRLEENPADADALAAQQAEAAEAMERLGGWDRLHEADALMDNLGIAEPERTVETLSGGERRRVALARLLLAAPDLAILDEPSNHLDIATLEWLEVYLRDRFKGALLLISHDRSMLEAVTSRTLELHPGGIESYDGAYARYVEARALRAAHAERSERNRQNFLRRELAWLQRSPRARATRQKARLKRAEAALALPKPEAQRSVDLRAQAERQGKQILDISGLCVERAGRRLVEGLDLRLVPGQRIGIVGPNGAGKSTLLQVLRGELRATEGTLAFGKNTRIGSLSQDRDDLDDTLSVRANVAADATEIDSAGQRVRVEDYLARFLFSPSAQKIRVGELSGGERARVCLARLLWQPNNLLLLDEPTNDLDVATLAALEAMLQDYAGSVLVVSHDRWFLDRVATSILAFEEAGRVTLYNGGWSDYRARAPRGASKSESAPDSAAGSRRALRNVSRPARLGFKEKRELEALPDALEVAEAEVRALEERLADPATYKEAGPEVGRLRDELEAAQERARLLYARWEELETRDSEASS